MIIIIAILCVIWSVVGMLLFMTSVQDVRKDETSYFKMFLAALLCGSVSTFVGTILIITDAGIPCKIVEFLTAFMKKKQRPAVAHRNDI